MREDLFVTNNNDFTHEDRYDGQDYVFPPKEKIVVPSLAATHMLGFNLPDKTNTLHRLGWGSKVDPKTNKVVDDPEGIKRLANFVFTRAMLVEERIDPEVKSSGEAKAEIKPRTGIPGARSALPMT